MENPTEYKRERSRRSKDDLTKCQDCSDILTDINWAPSMQKYKRYTCKKCWVIRQANYGAKNKQTILDNRKAVKENWSKDKRRLESEKAYFNRILKTHGITKEEYNLMIENQYGSCAICLSKSISGRGRWHVDHCHSSGKVRGLLCKNCNLFLGLAKDNIQTLGNAIKYLGGQYGNDTDTTLQ